MNPTKTATIAPIAFPPLAFRISPPLTPVPVGVSVIAAVGVITAVTVEFGDVVPEPEPKSEPVPPETVLGTPEVGTSAAAFW